MKLLDQALLYKTNLDVALLFKEITKESMICTDIEKKIVYIYNKKTTLYEQIGISQVASIIQDELLEFVREKFKNNKDQEKIKCFKSLIKSIGTQHFINDTAKTLCSKISDYNHKKLTDELDVNPEVMNFTNGILNLRTLEFRKRTKNDYFSKCLPYEYSTKVDKKISDKVYEIYYRICNSDEKMLKRMLRWYGYFLTGYTKEQSFLVCIGSKAGNGKSLLIKSFDKSFSIYCQKIDRHTFSEDFTKVHKQVVKLKAPVRLSYIEEQDKKKLEVDLLKDYVDGDKIVNEIMYGTSEDIRIQAKLTMNTNNIPNFGYDKGIIRRGHVEYFESEFLPYDEYKLNKHRDNVHLLDNSLDEKFDKNDKYKLALLQMLLPYAQEYLKNGKMTIDTEQKNKFKEMVEENDKIKNFVDKFFVKTNNESNRVSKEDFLNLYQDYYKLRGINFNHIINDIKRLGITYNPKKRCKGIQGCLVGIQFKEKADGKNSPLDSFIDDEDDKDEDKGDLEDIRKENNELKNTIRKLEMELEKLKKKKLSITKSDSESDSDSDTSKSKSKSKTKILKPPKKMKKKNPIDMFISESESDSDSNLSSCSDSVLSYTPSDSESDIKTSKKVKNKNPKDMFIPSDSESDSDSDSEYDPKDDTCSRINKIFDKHPNNNNKKKNKK